MRKGIELAQKYNAAIRKSSASPISGKDLTELMVASGGMEFLVELFLDMLEEVLRKTKQFVINALSPLAHALIISVIGLT